MKRTRIKPVSAKRARENRQRAKLRLRMIETHGVSCQAGILGVCDGRWTDMHERLSRARGGSVTDPDNIVLLCRPCHRLITEHPAWAEANGWALHSWDAA